MEIFPPCQLHQESQKEFLWIRKNDVQLCCSQCLYSKQNLNNSVSMKNIVHLRMISSEPELLLYKVLPQELQQSNKILTKLPQSSKTLEDYLIQIAGLKKALDQFEGEITHLLEDNKNVQHQLRVNLNEIMGINKLIINLTKLQNNQLTNTDDGANQQIEDQVSMYIDDLQQNGEQITKQVQGLLEYGTARLKNSTRTMLSSIEKPKTLLRRLNKSIEGQIKLDYLRSSLMDDMFFSKLIERIEKSSNQTIGNFAPIFLGTRDGLSFSSLWNKIEAKEKLLFVFKSQSGQVFGAYTPCKWEELNTYQVDATGTSFLYSYTLGEIYPIKKTGVQYTQQLNLDKYLLFGGSNRKDQDIRINIDFASGMSRLGVGFEATGKDSSKESTYLFGGLNQAINECEVFQLS